ncbi:MAG: alpha/beta hydrolase, partial [Chloroflexi bacterium]|nr:alpha/beta hydrolase [Chloroflexota bacterium]
MAQVDYTALDDPNISMNSFYPRQGWTPTPEGVQDYTVNVGDGSGDGEDIGLSCRFFPVGNNSPTILFFYGNGETAIDYDSIAPMYNQIGVNFFVADYRGYGKSGGSPSFTTMLSDANTVLDAMRIVLGASGFQGP